MKGKERLSLLRLKPLAANVAPHPIIFNRVPGMRGILMFKPPCQARPARLEKCTDFGIDPTALGEQLKPGLTTPETSADF
jgi:hypothetical protein